MSKIDFIKECIANAEKGESILKNNAALHIQGFTGLKIKHILSNLGKQVTNGFEIGCHKGSMTVATNLGNKINYFVCDNWTQFEEGGNSKKAFYMNIDFYGISPSSRLKVLEQDCWTIDLSKLPKIDFYIFDGEHSYDSQKKALTHFKSILSDEFILIVDDYNWDDVRNGTEDGLKESGMEVLFSEHLGKNKESDGEGYWNGLFVGLIKNNNNG